MRFSPSYSNIPLLRFPGLLAPLGWQSFFVERIRADLDAGLGNNTSVLHSLYQRLVIPLVLVGVSDGKLGYRVIECSILPQVRGDGNAVAGARMARASVQLHIFA